MKIYINYTSRFAKKKKSFNSIDTKFPFYFGYLRCLTYCFSTMVCASPLNLLNKRYCIIPFHVDVVFLGGKKSLTKHKLKSPLRKPTPLFSSLFPVLSFPHLVYFPFLFPHCLCVSPVTTKYFIFSVLFLFLDSHNNQFPVVTLLSILYFLYCSVSLLSLHSA